MKKDSRFYYRIAPTSGVPIYRQIMDQTKTQIAVGSMKPGTFLPSVREVAKEIEINPMTVSKAYSLLQKEGVIEFVRGQGMRVISSAGSEKDLGNRYKEMRPLLEEVVRKAGQLSLNREILIRNLNALWAEAKNE